MCTYLCVHICLHHNKFTQSFANGHLGTNVCQKTVVPYSLKNIYIEHSQEQHFNASLQTINTLELDHYLGLVFEKKTVNFGEAEDTQKDEEK